MQLCIAVQTCIYINAVKLPLDIFPLRENNYSTALPYITVVGRKHNHNDHDVAFTMLLQTARRCNVKLNYEKLQYKCTEVNFYSETYTTDDNKLAQSKITAIVNMPSPSSKKEVQSFIGIINYLSKSHQD